MTKENEFMKRFKKQIIDNSTASNYEEAIKQYVHVCRIELKTNCICGHEIYDVCLVRNKETGIFLNIGNVCITKFADKTSLCDEMKLYDKLEKKKKSFETKIKKLEVKYNKEANKTFEDYEKILTEDMSVLSETKCTYKKYINVPYKKIIRHDYDYIKFMMKKNFKMGDKYKINNIIKKYY